MSDLKIAIMNDGQLVTYRNPHEVIDEWNRNPGLRQLTVKLKSDENGIVADGKSRPTLKDLADYFGLPHDPTRTITDSEMRSLLADLRERTTIPACAFARAGFTVTLDPELTNKDRLTKLIDDEFSLGGLLSLRIADHLSKAGVTAPGGGNE